MTAPDTKGIVLRMWGQKRYDTVQIAEAINISEAEVERIIHADREARRRAVA